MNNTKRLLIYSKLTRFWRHSYCYRAWGCYSDVLALLHCKSKLTCPHLQHNGMLMVMYCSNRTIANTRYLLTTRSEIWQEAGSWRLSDCQKLPSSPIMTSKHAHSPFA